MSSNIIISEIVNILRMALLLLHGNKKCCTESNEANFLTPSPMVNKLIIPTFLKLLLTESAYISATASIRLHKHCRLTAATR